MIRRVPLALAFAQLASFACINSGDESEQEGVLRYAQTHSADSAPATSLSRDTTATSAVLPGLLRTTATVPVENWSGPGGQPFDVAIRTENPATAHARRFGTIVRATSLRERAPDLGQYPCTSCHLGRALVLSDKRIEDVHQNIQPEHPRQTGATCSTCHAADNVERLTLKSGERATLEHTYRLCAQCHFSQVEAWAGGGHGKRLDGWRGRRVVMGCADCHDPHRPAVESRIPFRAPRLKRPGSAPP